MEAIFKQIDKIFHTTIREIKKINEKNKKEEW